jgi:hypothetical protein
VVDILAPSEALTKVRRPRYLEGFFGPPYPEIAIVEPSEATAISVPSP